MGTTRKYIHEKVSVWPSSHGLYEFILESTIPRTMNANGMFINLTALSEDDIKLIYNRLRICESYTELTEDTLSVFHSYEIPKKIEVKDPPLKKITLTKIQHRILKRINLPPQFIPRLGTTYPSSNNKQNQNNKNLFYISNHNNPIL